MSGVQTGMTNTVNSDPPLPGMSGVQTGMTNTQIHQLKHLNAPIRCEWCATG